MSNQPARLIEEEVTLARNVHVGGNVAVNGDIRIAHDLKVEGRVFADNICGPEKGLFRSPSHLRSVYPIPQDGWWALVGESVPGTVYIARNGEWTSGLSGAPSTNSPDKGLFETVTALRSTYPSPGDGWWALVGRTLPAHLHVVSDGAWVPAYNPDGSPTLVGIGQSLYRMEIDTDGDCFMAFGERKTIRCKVWCGFEDVTANVLQWKATRRSSDEISDRAWGCKPKVKNFAGELEICFDSEENDLGPDSYNVRTVFTFGALIAPGEEVLHELEF